jgi:phenylacetate-coenzyme A ligase PaaK-like adenylate-forming protein
MDNLSQDNAVEFLKKLPILDKESLRETHDRLVARNARRLRLGTETKSGSTGTPLTVLRDRGSNVMEVCCIQGLFRWTHFRIG